MIAKWQFFAESRMIKLRHTSKPEDIVLIATAVNYQMGHKLAKFLNQVGRFQTEEIADLFEFGDKC